MDKGSVNMKFTIETAWRQFVDVVCGKNMNTAIEFMKEDSASLDDARINAVLIAASSERSPVDRGHIAFDAFRLIASHYN